MLSDKERLAFCKQCHHRTFDPAQGILCSITLGKPNFEDQCDDFYLDESVAQAEEMRNKSNLNSFFVSEKEYGEPTMMSTLGRLFSFFRLFG